ncbi:5-(carboxyamino)imidazole ribonucleotide synthase [Dethiothermospora halolimnae]|uniref:5-(carboxyamino)imidazole ribonucleotide synthase n=1 Tax=Dethiothermospora halolimnae TaxID=3114390 RepID=UPI003CCB88A2
MNSKEIDLDDIEGNSFPGIIIWIRGDYVNPRAIKIGIIGGGQLGKMLIQEAKKMDFTVIVLDPSKNSPCKKIADKHIEGDLHDEDKIKELVKKCDVTTFEIENINTEVLSKLEDKGHKIFPSPKILEIIKDKSKQKEFLDKNNIPTSKWERITHIEKTANNLGMPFVQKACCGGYDGRGVQVINGQDDFKNSLKGDSFGEKYVDFKKELAVMVSRNINGDIKSFPVVEMDFNHGENICDTIIAPAKVSKDIEKRAKKLALECIKAFDGIGVFGVEMFLTKNDEILINEIAPRVHNSGHYTIESCTTSQFEQHIRCICGLPLGSTELILPSVVTNILGEENQYGEPYYKGMTEALEIPGVNVHIYGKSEVKPFRKMGHVTVVDKDRERAIKKSNDVKNILKAISKKGANNE